MKIFCKSTIGSLSVIFLCIFCMASPAFAQLGATLIDDNIPSEMHPGETRRLSVTMENTGNEAWTGLVGEENDFRLASQNYPR